MAKKIILFLSTINDGAKEMNYTCPDGGSVTGTQTNEAPVKYLLRAWPEVSEILCIVTPKAEELAWDWIVSEVGELSPGVRVTRIPFPDGENFTRGPLRELLDHTESGDEILLETTGGLRDHVMYLLLTSRVLSYAGVETLAATYSNNTTKEIQDVSHLIRLFDLVGGMQELTSFGSTRTLRKYYGRPAGDERIEALLSAVEGLQDAVMLCRTEQLEERVEKFEAAMTAAGDCGDLLMQQLLPAFRRKFGRFGPKMSVLSVIKWCVESDMLQQALTIYNERVPAYLLRDQADPLFTLKPGAPRGNRKDYRSDEEAQFTAQFIAMGGAKVNQRNFSEDDPADKIAFALDGLANLLPDSHIKRLCSYPKLRDVFMDYFYIRALRNMTNHARDEVNPGAQHLERVLTEYGYKKLSEVTAADVKKTLENALEHLRKDGKKK